MLEFAKQYAESVDQTIMNECNPEIKIPWGSWDLNGNWHHNIFLKATKEEQREANIKNGYIC